MAYKGVLNNKHRLPRTLYQRVLFLVRDYDRQKEVVDDILYGTSIQEGGSSGRVGKPTEGAAIRLARYTSDIDAIEDALEVLPKEYRRAVFDNIRFRKPFPQYASYRTWLRWRQRFIYEVAGNLKLI